MGSIDTEIDWSTYMEQVSVFVNGSREYSEIKGSTGPCVYPAGHLYFFSILYFLTNQGTSILKAQFIFLLIYMVNGLMVMEIYRSILKVPPFVLGILFWTSYRVHSIFMLRLFNDTLAVTLCHASLVLFIRKRCTLASLVFRSVLVSPFSCRSLVCSSHFGRQWHHFLMEVVSSLFFFVFHVLKITVYRFLSRWTSFSSLQESSWS